MVDLTYGLLIAISVGLIVVAGNAIGLAFGFGVLLSYVIHVVWKMARFDPDWMTTAVKETVEETVDDLAETVSTTEADVDAIREDVDSVEDDLSEDIDSLWDTVEEVEELAESAVDADDIADIRARMDDVEDGIEALEQFRAGLSSAFGVDDDS